MNLLLQTAQGNLSFVYNKYEKETAFFSRCVEHFAVVSFDSLLNKLTLAFALIATFLTNQKVLKCSSISQLNEICPSFKVPPAERVTSERVQWPEGKTPLQSPGVMFCSELRKGFKPQIQACCKCKKSYWTTFKDIYCVKCIYKNNVVTRKLSTVHIIHWPNQQKVNPLLDATWQSNSKQYSYFLTYIKQYVCIKNAHQ